MHIKILVTLFWHQNIEMHCYMYFINLFLEHSVFLHEEQKKEVKKLRCIINKDLTNVHEVVLKFELCNLRIV